MERNRQSSAPRPLSAAGSMVLDVARFLAALAVAFGHLSSPMFSTGWTPQLELALDGVAVFFVLSGFVIRLVTTVRPVHARDYFVDRASRIYSVVLPAIVFTLLVGRLVHVPRSAGQLSMELAANLTFSAQFWGLDIPVSFNNVFWSLSYECAYYALYGFAFFARGPQRVWSLALLCLLIGPPILFMLPLWCLGCGIHDLYQRLCARHARNAMLVMGISAACAAVATLLRAAFMQGAAVVTRIGSIPLEPLYAVAKRSNIHLLQRASPRFYAIGIPTAIILLVLLLACEAVPLARTNRTVRFVRVIADSTFSLYLLHLPLLLLANFYLPYNHGSALQKCALLALIVVLCILAQHYMDRLKNWMRKAASISPAALRKVVA